MTIVQDVKSRTDLVDLVSEHVTLQKAGRNLKANCPFHTERTPSFVVFPDRQTWRCFGACATGGDAIAFVMKVDNTDFAQALEHLAQRAGLTVPTRQTRDPGAPLAQVNDAAQEFFRQVLHSPQGGDARRYLERRGVNQEAEGAFMLGLSPGGWDALTAHLIRAGHREQDILAAGLAVQSDDGQVRDLFHRRLMFPIADNSGQVVGFGGRSLDDSGPKYLNTPRTAAFDKGHILYGLSIAKESIRLGGSVVIVEGYMDVIAAHQHGFPNVVASMGTALTEHQVGAVQSIASTFVLALDPDNAGREATLRSLESSWRVFERRALRSGGRRNVVFYERPPHASLKVALLPDGKDPDLLIREDPAEWERLTVHARPILDYLFEVISSKFDLSSPQGKAQAADALLPLITSLANSYDQDRHFRQLAELLSVSESALEASIGRPQARRPAQGQRGRNAASRASAGPLTGSHRDHLEEMCLYLLLQRPELSEAGSQIPPEHFELSENRDLFTNWTICSTMEVLRAELPDGLLEHLSAILSIDPPPLDTRESARALEEVAGRLKERFLKQQAQALLEQMEGADWNDVSSMKDSLIQAQEINQQLRALFSGPNPTP